MDRQSDLQEWLFITVGLILLILPMWMLSDLRQNKLELAVISIFILCFAVLLIVGSPIRPSGYHILAAAAA